MPTRTPAKTLVRTAEQVRAISGPLPHRITAVMERLGPCTVREVAEAIGEEPETLYYHVRRLHRVGLLRERGHRRSGPNLQTLYELPGRELVFDHHNTEPAFLAALARAVGALLRMADRAYAAALGDPAGRRLGPRRNLMLQQHDFRLPPRRLAELNRRLEDIAAFVAEHDDPRRDDWVSLTMIMAPRARSRRPS